MTPRRWERELHELVVARGRALTGYAYFVCGDRREAEDLVQEALVRVISRLNRLPEAPGGAAVHAVDGTPAHFTSSEAYVRSAILTAYLDRYRRERNRRTRSLGTWERPVGGPEGAVAVRLDVASALDLLTPRQRACVVLRFYDDLTVPDVAAVLGLAPGTVKRYLSDANVVLRGALDDWGPVGVRAGLQDALASGAPGARSGALEDSEAAIRARIRNRRRVRAAVVGGMSAVVVALVAFGAAQALSGRQEAPLPAVPSPSSSATPSRSLTPSPSPSLSPSATASPTPTEAAPFFSVGQVATLLVPDATIGALAGFDGSGNLQSEELTWEAETGTEYAPAECAPLVTVNAAGVPLDGYRRRFVSYPGGTFAQTVTLFADEVSARAAFDSVGVAARGCESVAVYFTYARDPMNFEVTAVADSATGYVLDYLWCADSYYCAEGYLGFVRVGNAIVQWDGRANNYFIGNDEAPADPRIDRATLGAGADLQALVVDHLESVAASG
ncbi:sigma-70 family RNA polymerase sigma factor [Antribacter sp. KLBMP9083]|uniref:Sigma-70 family RNA polymerase sigma factor n=1 Tax=Antribacter soli TaxID=2910976 RepID=A0AA41QGR5_9MICO|nr:sigma-70 family RNA polymerase sigma factor [Antribacter soli]MCF4121794.1 sigma-70 family RNA polymerase sigma factor [Antribacter soli]